MKQRPSAEQRYNASLGFPFLIIMLVSVELNQITWTHAGRKGERSKMSSSEA